jgi:hypothetical protein
MRGFEATMDTFPGVEILLPHITVLTEGKKGLVGDGFEFGFDGGVFVVAVVDFEGGDDAWCAGGGDGGVGVVDGGEEGWEVWCLDDGGHGVGVDGDVFFFVEGGEDEVDGGALAGGGSEGDDAEFCDDHRKSIYLFVYMIWLLDESAEGFAVSEGVFFVDLEVCFVEVFHFLFDKVQDADDGDDAELFVVASAGFDELSIKTGLHGFVFEHLGAV